VTAHDGRELEGDVEGLGEQLQTIATVLSGHRAKVDAGAEVEQLVAEGDKLVAGIRMTGTQTGSAGRSRRPGGEDPDELRGRRGNL
jgi:hypothetical protein